MLRLLALAAGAFWLRKPENRELAERKIKEAWHRVMNSDDKGSQEVDPYHDHRPHQGNEAPHDDKREL